jgi:hypothetical protein
MRCIQIYFLGKQLPYIIVSLLDLDSTRMSRGGLLTQRIPRWPPLEMPGCHYILQDGGQPLDLPRSLAASKDIGAGVGRGSVRVHLQHLPGVGLHIGGAHS